MAGIKDLMGLLFWMDNSTMPAMKAVSKGERDLSKNKTDILKQLEGDSNYNGASNSNFLPKGSKLNGHSLNGHSHKK